MNFNLHNLKGTYIAAVAGRYSGKYCTIAVMVCECVTAFYCYCYGRYGQGYYLIIEKINYQSY